MNEIKKPGSLFFPMLLVAVGVFLFLINIGSVPGTIWQNLTQYWPAILIIAGLDGVYRRDGWIGPLVLLGFGTILLLGNLHYLEFSGFTLLLKLWPIILVAIGLDVILGHRGSIWNNLFRVLLGLLLVGGIVWLAALSPFFSMGMRSVPFEQSLDNAKAADLRFAEAVGEMYLRGGADEDLLVSGSAGMPKEMDLSPKYTAPQNGRSSLTLEGNGVVIVPISSATSPWNFEMNSEIPIDLKAELGIGEMEVDLSKTQVTEVETEMGIGQTVLTLPSGVDMDVVASGAIGELVIRIPRGAEVSIKTDQGIVGLDYPETYEKDHDIIRSTQADKDANEISIDVDLAIGSIRIEEIE